MQETKSCEVAQNSEAKERYDSKSKDLKELSPGTTVRIFNRSKNGNWRQRGKIITKRSEPRSYDVLNDRGNTVRRNRRHLLPTKEKFDENDDTDIDADDSSDVESSEAVTPEINDTIPVQLDNDPEGHNYVTRYGRVSKQPDRYGT